MKNVLFATTALVATAFAGSAFAGAHDSGNFGISGSTSIGYTESSDEGLFADTNVDIKASGEIAPGYDASFHGRLNLDLNEAGESTNVELKGGTLMTPAGTLSYSDDMDGATAADEFYKDRDGMSLDVPGADDDAGIKWVGDFGDFGYAVSTGADDGDGDIPDNWTLGLGGSFGDVTVGLGYDDVSETVGVSADFGLGDYNVGLSYANNDSETSIGVQGSATFGDFKVGAYYASNDVADDQYGILLDYASGPVTVGIDFNIGETEDLEIDVAFDVADGMTIYAGYDQAEGDNNGNDGIYVGLVADVADNITATISYAEWEDAGPKDFKSDDSAEGDLSAFLSIAF